MPTFDALSAHIEEHIRSALALLEVVHLRKGSVHYSEFLSYFLVPATIIVFSLAWMLGKINLLRVLGLLFISLLTTMLVGAWNVYISERDLREYFMALVQGPGVASVPAEAFAHIFLQSFFVGSLFLLLHPRGPFRRVPIFVYPALSPLINVWLAGFCLVFASYFCLYIYTGPQFQFLRLIVGFFFALLGFQYFTTGSKLVQAYLNMPLITWSIILSSLYLVFVHVVGVHLRIWYTPPKGYSGAALLGYFHIEDLLVSVLISVFVVQAHIYYEFLCAQFEQMVVPTQTPTTTTPPSAPSKPAAKQANVSAPIATSGQGQQAQQTTQQAAQQPGKKKKKKKGK